jgi:uncharacterized protein involved in outer membrane biogenesis
MKKIGIGAGILLILLIGSALVIPSFLDWNQYKTQIVNTASELSGRTVAINGDLSLTVLPSPSFSAEDVSVSNVAGGQAENFITLKSVDVNVAFFPLLRGEVQVTKFILVEPVVAIEIDENGRGNWEFGSEDDQQTTTDTGAEYSFDQFQIENGQLSYQDLSNGTQELVRMINADVTIESLQGPFEITGDARYKNLPVSLDLMVGTIREGRKVPVNLTAGLLDDDVEIKFVGGFLPDDVSPQADGKINIDADEFGDVFLALSLLDQENTNQNGPEYNYPLSLETTMAYGGDAINISAFDFEMGESRGTGNLKATFGNLTRFEGGLTINSFNLDSFLPALDGEGNSLEGANPNKEEFDYSFLEQIEGTFEFRLGALQYNDKIASQLDLDITASNSALDFTRARVNMPGGSELSLRGAFSAPQNKPFFNGNVSLNSGNFRAFLDWLKIDTSTIPQGRLTRLDYNGVVQIVPEMVQLYGIDGSLDTFKFSGGVSYALQDRTSMGLDVAIESLNIDNYLIEDESEKDIKSAVAILADFDANYKIALSNLTVQGVSIKKVSLSGELFEGSLNAKSIDVEDYAGFNLNGSLIGNNLANNPLFETSFNTTATSLVPLQRAFRFQTTFDVANVGAVSVNGRMNGNFEQLNLDMKSTIGSSKADIKGEVRSATLTQLPNIGSVDLEIVASNPSLISLINQFGLPLVKASANDDRPFAVETTVKGTKELIDIDGNWTVAGGNIALKGRTNLLENEISSYDLAVNIQSNNLREFIRGMGSDFRPSNSNLGGLALDLAASGNMTEATLNNIVGTVGPTKVTGSGKIGALDAVIEEGGKRTFDFNLVLDTVPVTDFMEASAELAEGDEWGNWSREPMELATLEEYEGRANITANRINYEKYNFENPRFEAVLQNGILNITNFTGKLFGGDVAVAGTFSSQGDLDMNMSLKNATIVDATSSFAGISPVSGNFDMEQKFTAKGLSQQELISSLSGNGTVTASPGTIHGIDIPALSGKLDSLSNKTGLLNLLTSALSGGQTPYEGGSSIITTSNGFIKLSPFDIKMLGAESAVDMGVNLAQWQMNLSGDMSLVDHPDAPPIGIRVLGDLHDPKISYNTARLEGYVGEKIAASLLQNMVEGNGGIGGIFGGIPGATPNNSPVTGTDGEPAPAQGNVTTTPLEDFSTPPPPEQETAQPQEQQPANETQNNQPESVRELGTRLLERLFQRPSPPQN